ncbi:hypothetical protein PV08_02984 [Exophiala spinifera]|uniref:Protein LOT5 n=1 Tax=Exophiala spinifera TaxID=91928 RepID=A0A0D2BJC1_9EURO|nr:uncharacterized protein PV08_02984 [Exophiala spinifera]KIW18695.1 hypothetical protein PV08_02984 [Exophiala spinifera]
MEVLTEQPKTSSFTPLAEHQATTPASFYSGPPVLHYYSDRSKIVVLQHEVESLPAFAPLLSKAEAVSTSHANGTETANGDSNEAQSQKVLDDVDVWVASDKLYLFSASANSGVSIPYPSISLHAIQSLPAPEPLGASSADAPAPSQGVYMQLVTSSEETDEEPDSISITIVPTASGPPEQATDDSNADPIATEDKPLQTPVTAMFNALSNCSNLHPDPVEPGDEDEDQYQSHLFQTGLAFPGASDGGLPPAMPGSGGWITAENMHEYFDEEGNWIGKDGDEEEQQQEVEGENLGPGAGTVRPRQEEDTNGNGEPADGNEETKWQRTS